MVKFIDGPLDGVSLCLRRAPLFIRATVGNGCVFDALDQHSDEPGDDEQLYAYRRIGDAGSVHVNGGRRSVNGWYALATYRIVPEQPSDITMRNAKEWQRWTIARATQEKPESQP